MVSPGADAYAAAHTTPFTGELAAAAEWTAGNMPWPQMMAGRPEARLLEALIVAGGAQRVLEFGTFTGVGALALAAALPEGGRVTTLEIDPEMAAIARRHFAASPVGDRIDLIVGDALTTLEGLDGPFDLVWIDAQKTEYTAYYEAVVPKLSSRGVIAADNLFMDGAALSPSRSDSATQAILEFARHVQEDERVHNVLLTIGDGVLLAWRVPS